MGWVWTALVVWVLLAVLGAVVLGRVVRRADREELEAPAGVPGDALLPRPTPPPSEPRTP